MSCKSFVCCVLIILSNCLSFQTIDAQSTSSNKTATIALRFNNVAGKETIKLDSETYTNVFGENFTVTFLQYFISNIKLMNLAGKEYAVPQDSSYFLIKEDDSTSQICSIHAPADEYKAISFMVGVDSLRNTMNIDKRTGVLDPTTSDMYWQWNSGYICLKIEGISSSAPADPLGLHKFRYHIGGFGGYNSRTLNNTRMVTLIFQNPVNFITDTHNSINILADVLKLFSATANVSIAVHPEVMFDKYSAVIANNYAQMFSILNIEIQ